MPTDLYGSLSLTKRKKTSGYGKPRISKCVRCVTGVTFLHELEKVLGADKRFLGEKNEIIKTKVADAAKTMDASLLKSLLGNALLKQSFFTKVDAVYVFDKIKFIWVLESKQFLPDSYTLYKQQIGLVDSQDNLISQKDDVTLVWPYKDCVLEGGQTKEDQKRDEVFYSETLAPDQVNRLLAPKVFSNAKRYTADGVEENIKFTDDDNLIIKGNNLPALSSLLKRYEGKVQCIYIDPPYNTGSDGFNYNDSFNHSSWLTFMKNRLEIARQLLSKNGTIWITLNDVEVHYLKVLCDGVFTRECFVTQVEWQHSDNSNNNALTFSEDVNHILVYSKESNWKPNFLNDLEKRKHFKNPDNDPKGPWFDGNPVNNPGLRPNLQFNITAPNGNIIKHPANGWRWSKKTMDEKFATGELRFSDDYSRVIRRTYLCDMGGLPPSNLWTNLNITGHTRKAKYELKRLFPDIPVTSLFATPKPELLINHIFDLATKPGDLVLDFFMGSGTTCAVAHKKQLHYVGVEQMDYIHTFAIPRLQKVIEGEEGGISKDVNWQGGGSFVYCELLEDNEKLIREIAQANNTEVVKKVLNRAIQNGKLVPSVLPDDIKETGKEFEDLSLEEQKKIVVELLEKKKLYVNLSDIDDEIVAVNESDKVFTKSFYGLK